MKETIKTDKGIFSTDLKEEIRASLKKISVNSQSFLRVSQV